MPITTKRGAAAMSEKCKYYEPDLTALKEAETMEAAYLETMNAAEREALETWATMNPADEQDPLKNCGPCCKYLKSGKGHSGEYVYYCEAPGVGRILHVDFNESEII